ncbi:MAG TPA: outer membrane beta-barrel protein [Flavobacterium sp.]|nr:outer membrane beta-barrel protein [Flavobacterium sp.]
MKKIILLVLLTLAVVNSYSQEKGRFRVGLDLGYVPASGGGGGLVSLEPKYNINDNMNVGLRLGGASVVRDLVTNDNDEYTAKVAGIGSFVGTYDYYFHKSGSGSSLAPYIGAGLGYYSLANVEVDDSNVDSGELDPAVSGVFGGLIRGGLEWAGFRMGLEYNFLPDSDIENLNGDIVGTASNSYVGISIGFFVGGGKWGRKAK